MATVDSEFEGCGALGTAYLGALRLLEDSRIRFGHVAANSAGAITAAMIAAGFTAREIEALSSGFDGADALPDSLSDVGITERIKFIDFLDNPEAATILRPNKRRTYLWKALNVSVLDVMGTPAGDLTVSPTTPC